mgnify:CR=1 FL=1
MRNIVVASSLLVMGMSQVRGVRGWHSAAGCGARARHAERSVPQFATWRRCVAKPHLLQPSNFPPFIQPSPASDHGPPAGGADHRCPADDDCQAGTQGSHDRWLRGRGRGRGGGRGRGVRLVLLPAQRSAPARYLHVNVALACPASFRSSCLHHASRPVSDPCPPEEAHPAPSAPQHLLQVPPIHGLPPKCAWPSPLARASSPCCASARRCAWRCTLGSACACRCVRMAGGRGQAGAGRQGQAGRRRQASAGRQGQAGRCRQAGGRGQAGAGRQAGRQAGRRARAGRGRQAGRQTVTQALLGGAGRYLRRTCWLAQSAGSGRVTHHPSATTALPWSYEALGLTIPHN